jgi:excisionase family DNA binding protein
LLQAAASSKPGEAAKGSDRQEAEDGGGSPRLISIKEAAAILRVCTATVYSMVERGELPHVRVSNSIRIILD